MAVAREMLKRGVSDISLSLEDRIIMQAISQPVASIVVETRRFLRSKYIAYNPFRFFRLVDVV